MSGELTSFPLGRRLLSAQECVLVVVDLQPGFLGRLLPDPQRRVLERARFAVVSAHWCGVPVIATVERPEAWGELHPDIPDACPGVPVVRKEVFGLGDDPEVLRVVDESRRPTVVLCGMETDVCIAHSALSLQPHGYQVACLVDAVATPGPSQLHDAGLERMRTAGVLLLSAKQLHYEWLRTVERARRFHADHPEIEVDLPPAPVLTSSPQ